MPQENDQSRESSPFKLISTRDVYRNPWIAVREDRVRRPNGGEGIFGVITMKPGSTILAITADQQIFVTREYKYGIAAHSLELVSGAIETNESPLEAARRELQEELGQTAAEWIDCGRIDPFTTVVSSPNYMFIAMGLTQGAQNLDAGEVLSVIKMPLLEAIEMAMDGRITHGASCVLILKAKHILRRRGLLP